jgi:hypothetical protein
MTVVIGVDFDNTIICYDELLHTLSIEWGLIPEGYPANKKEIRDYIRSTKNGELKWQKLQASVYGNRINEAVMFDGVREFFESCIGNNIEIYIVSHKTVHPAQDKNINLRKAALDWMIDNKFLKTSGLSSGLAVESVFFEATRKEKIDRIRKLGCTHFIDDLLETYFCSVFPSKTSKILFSPLKSEKGIPGIKTLSTWKEIYNEFF